MARINFKVNTSAGERFFVYSTIVDEIIAGPMQEDEFRTFWMSNKIERLKEELEEIVSSIHERGSSSYIEKPFDVDGILSCIKNTRDIDPADLIQSLLGPDVQYLPYDEQH